MSAVSVPSLVEGAMKFLGISLKWYKLGRTPATKRNVERCVYELAHAVRTEIARRWQTNLPNTQENNCPRLRDPDDPLR